MPRTAVHRGAGRICAVALIILSAVLVTSSPAAAATIKPFGIRFQADTNGAIDIFGNTLLTCPGSCAAAQNPPLSSTTYLANNNYSMVQVDADGTAFTTANSSMVTVSYPAGSVVRFAGLYWGATSTSTTRNQAQFRRPGDTAYSTVTAAAANLYASGGDYQAFVDVTSAVAAAGPGQYWLGDVRLQSTTNSYAGWSLVVVWENASQPLRNLTVFDGYGIVQNTTADRTISIPLSGFLTPPFGAVNAEVGAIAYEGDRGSTGDSFRLNNTNLGDAANPTNDFFNSTISTGGAIDGGRNPNYVNTLGYDADEVNASGILPNSATTATVTLTTGGETFYPGVVTTQIDLYSPSFPELTKSVVDVNGGDALPGDELEYNIVVTNVGLDPSLQTVLTDAIPAGTAFVPGSIRVDGAARTDATGDDTGFFASNTVTVNAGTGATPSAGGTLNPNASVNVKFRVTVLPAAVGTTISNTYRLDYRAQTLNKPFSYRSNQVDTPVPPIADLAIVKTASPSPIVAGANATYTLQVTNNGPSAATNVRITDALPAGVALVSTSPSAGTCSNGPPLTCNLGTVASGASATVSVVVTASNALASGALLTNAASVDADTLDLNTANDLSTITTPVTTSADVRVGKTASPSPLVPGNNATFTITVTNDGPSVARAVSVTDVLPPSVTLGSITPSDPADICTGLTCALGDLAPGATATITVVGQVNPSLPDGSSVVNTATATSTTADPDPADNTGTSTSSVDAQANVSVAKTIVTDPIVPGQPVTFQVVASNAGPSSATGVVVSDPLPPGYTATSASSTSGTCTLGATVSCAVGTLPPGGSATVTIVANSSAALADGSTASNTATVASPDDTTPGNNSSTDTAPVDAQAQLQLVKTATPNVVAGGPITYTIAVTNSGPSNATNVAVNDTLPADVTATSVSPSSGSCSGASTINCSLGTIAPGATVTITINGSVAPGSTGTFTNTATATSPQSPNATASVATSPSALADLAVTKTAAGPVIAGQQATFTVQVTNNGPSTANGVTINDPLPPGFTLAAPVAADCSSAVGDATVDCARATLAPGGTWTVTIVADVNPAAAAGTVTNSVTVAASTPNDPTVSNNTATAPIEVRRSADVSVTKSASPNPVAAGENVTFTLTASNAGPSSAEAVVVSDPLPAGLTFVVAGSSPSCSAADQLVTCTSPTLAAGGSVVFTVVAAVNAAQNPGALANTASASSATPDPTPANNAVTTPFTVVDRADLAVGKSLVTNPVVAGQPIEWQITVTNTGPSDARTVVVTDPAPAGVTLVSAIPSIGGPCTVTAASMNCPIGTIPLGGSATVTLRGTVAAAVSNGTVITNTVSATTSSNDPTPNTASAPATVTTSADVSITKRSTPNPIVAGEPVQWIIDVVNNGPSNAADVVVTDTIPAALTLQTVTTSAGACTPGATVSCTIPTLASGASATIVITTSTPGTLAAGINVDNTAAVTSTTPDPDPSDNASTVSVPVTALADLVIGKQSLAGEFVAGGPARWAIGLVNNGPSTATNVDVTDTLPPGVTLTNAYAIVGGAQVPCTVNTCTFASVLPGEIITVVVEGTVDASVPAGTVLTNAAAVTSDTTDPDPSSNTASSATPVSAAADLRLTKTASPSPVNAGQVITWTITVTNDGPSDAQSTSVTDPLPANTTFVSATVPGGACTVASRIVTCPTGVIPAGGSVIVTISARLSSGFAAASIANTATVTSTTTDGNPANNSATATTPVNTPADMSITKTGPAGPLNAGQSISYTIRVDNLGPAVARAVTVNDPLPAAVINASVTVAPSTAGTCTTAVVCTLGDVNPSDPVIVITVSGTIDPAFTGTSLANSATVTATNVDPNPANNSATATTSTATSADVSLTKAGPTGTVLPGNTITWTMQVSNAGPSVARSVVLSDALPAAIDLTRAITATPTAGTCTTGATVSCAIGDVATGATVTVTITATVREDVLDPSIVNTATVSSPTADPSAANNTATSTTPLAPVADVVVTKTVSPDPAIAGTPVSWTVQVRNDGPSTARDVVVTDTPPFALSNLVSTLGSCVLATGVCTIGSIPSGATVTITAQATVPATYTAATMTNTAVATSTTPDFNTGNNTGTSTSAVDTSADLIISKVSDNPVVVSGTALTYTITVTNNGPSVARSVVVDDDLPAPFVLGSISTACSNPAPPDLRCALGDVAVGETRTITISGTIDPSNTSPFSNAATVTSLTADPDPASNTASALNDPNVIADLGITKTVLTADPVAGNDVQWQIVVTNAGPSTASPSAADTVEITDTAPPGVTITAIASSTTDTGTVTCSATPVASGDDVVCSKPSLATGQRIVLTITGALDPAAPAGPLSNTATITDPPSSSDPSPDNNSATAIATVRRQADLQLTKTVSDGTVAPGEQVTYTIEVTNDGPSTAEGTTISDLLPDGFTFVSSVGCTAAGQLVSCAVGDLDPATSAIVTIVVAIDPDLAAGTVTNSAQAVSLTPGDAASDSVDVDLDRNAVLSLTKAANPDPVVAGETVTWTIELSNAGPSTAQTAVIGDLVADSMVVDGVTTTAGTCATSAAAGGTQVDCQAGTVAVGQTVTVTIVATVRSNVLDGTVINNLASAAADDANDVQAPATVDVQAVADLSVTKVALQSAAIAGQPVTWQFTVTNSGPSDAANVTITDAAPAGVTFTSATPAPLPLGCSLTAASFDCLFTTLPAGASLVFTLTGSLAASATAADLTNSVTIDSTTTDPVADNTSDVTIPVETVADVSVAKTLLTAAPTSGQPVRWQIVAGNSGPSVARDVVVTDEVPSLLNAANAIVTTVPTLPGACTFAAQILTCALGDLAPTSSVTITIEVPTDATTPDGDITNTATIATSTVDPDLSSNTSTAAGALGRSADLSIDKSAPATIIAGNTITYTLTVGNAGPSTATAVVVTDAVPAGVTVTAATATNGGVCTIGSTVACNFAVITVDAPSPTTTITIVGTVAASVADGAALVNEASVTSATPDGGSGPNSDQATTTVGTSADVAVTKTGPATTTTPGARGTWTISVSNAGPSDASAVVVTDVLPTSLADARVTSTAGTCTVTSGTLTCALGTLAAAATATVTIDALVVSDFTGASILNTASVSAATADPDTTNNQSQSTTATQPSADLQLAKAVVGGPYRRGDNVQFAITLTNAGPSTARDVVVTDQLPTGLTLVSMTSAAAGAACTGATCSFALVAPGAIITVDVVARADASGPITNTASVSSATPDPAPANGTAAAPVTVGRVVQIAVTKTASAAQVAFGANVTWTITVTNSGPDDATNIVVNEFLPAGLTFVSAAPSQGTYAGTQWAVGGLAAGASATLQLVTRVGRAGAVTNSISVAGDDQVTGVAVASLTVLPPRLPATGAQVRSELRVAALMLLAGVALLVGTTRSRRRVPVTVRRR